jgi:hypothetical protein
MKLITLTKEEYSKAVAQIARCPVSVHKVHIPASKGRAAMFEQVDGYFYLANEVGPK